MRIFLEEYLGLRNLPDSHLLAPMNWTRSIDLCSVAANASYMGPSHAEAGPSFPRRCGPPPRHAGVARRAGAALRR